MWQCIIVCPATTPELIPRLKPITILSLFPILFFISAINLVTKTKTHKIAFLEGNWQLSASEVYDVTESVMQDNYRLSYYYNIDRFNIKEFEMNSMTLQADIAIQLKKLNSY